MAPFRAKFISIGSDSASDLKDFLTIPARKLGSWDMRLHKVLPGFHFIEILFGSHRPGRMPDVAWACIPIGFDGIDRGTVKKVGVLKT
jgi:hypothetical protein